MPANHHHAELRSEAPVLGIIQVTLPLSGPRGPPLTEDEVAGIGSTWTRHEKDDESGGVAVTQDVCGICLSEFDSGDELTALPCASNGGCLSVWHAGCIRKWLCQGHLQRCPLCRTSFNLDGSPAPVEPADNEVGSTTFALELRTVQGSHGGSPFSVGVLGGGPALSADLIHELIFLSMLPSRADFGDSIGGIGMGSMGDIDGAREMPSESERHHGLSQVFLALRSGEVSVMRVHEHHIDSFRDPVATGDSATASQWPSRPHVTSNREAGAQISPPASGSPILSGHSGRTAFVLPRAFRGGPYAGAPATLRGSGGGPRGPRGGAGPVRQPRFPAFTEPGPPPATIPRHSVNNPARSTLWQSALGRPPPGVRPPPITHTPSGMSPGRRLGPRVPPADGAEAEEEDLDEHWGGSFRAASDTRFAVPFPRGARSPGGFTASGGYSSSSVVWGAQPRLATTMPPPPPPPVRPQSSWSARLTSEWPLNRVWNAMPRSSRP